MSEHLNAADYQWMVGKTFPGRNPKPQRTLDGRTITVLEVRAIQTDTPDFAAVFSTGLIARLRDSTNREWTTGCVENLIAELHRQAPTP